MKFRLDEQSLVETLEDAKKYYPNISQEDFDRVIAIDPTFSREQDKLGTYGKWLLRLFTKKALDDENKVRELLLDFDANKNNLKDKDIMKYTSVDELENMLNDDDSYKELSRRQSLRQVQKKVHKTDAEQDAEKVFENSNWVVYVPKTYEASCKLGRGTNWCTATTENDKYYKQYTRKGKLYINIDKNDTSEKYQFHFETKSYMYSDDEPIDIIDFFIENVDLFNFYKTIIGNNALSANDAKIIPTVSYLIKNPSDTFIYSKDTADIFEQGHGEFSERLKHLIIDKSITSIGVGVFMPCYRLTSITIPDSVTSIGEDAFSGCSRLNEVFYRGTKKQWNSIDISDGNGYLLNADIIFNSLKESVDTIKKQSNIPTDEQEDYFWASQVRDKQGNLLVCYHSSNTAREILNPRDTFVWFSVSEDYSKKYGSNTVACYLDITKPFIIGDTSVWFENKNRLLSINVNVDGREYKIKPSDAVIAIAKRLNISVKKLCEIQVRACALKDDDYKGYVLEFVNTPEFAKIVKDAGYDGIQTIEQGHLCFGTLYKDQAKAITNKAPTGELSIYE